MEDRYICEVEVYKYLGVSVFCRTLLEYYAEGMRDHFK